MKTVKHYEIVVPFKSHQQASENKNEYNILATNKYDRLVINDSCFTTLCLKAKKYSSFKAINEICVWKCNLGVSSDGWHVSTYYQCSDKVMKRKCFNALKKAISKELFISEDALRKLETLFKSK